MKFLAVFVLLFAVAAAYPTVESQPEVPPPPSPPSPSSSAEDQNEQKNTLFSAEAEPTGDNSEADKERLKRFIFFKFLYPFPVSYSYVAPVAYAAPVVTPVVTKTNVAYATPVVTKTVVKTAPLVSVQAPGVSVVV